MSWKIKMPSPAMVVNASDVSGLHYKMYNTRTVHPNLSPKWLSRNIASVAGGAPGGKLGSLILNCEGVSDFDTGDFLYLKLGTGIRPSDLTFKNFGNLRGLIDAIIIAACGAARGESGMAFCRKLAAVTHATVVASSENQNIRNSISLASKEGGIPAGYIDAFEGNVYQFPPYGPEVML